MSDLSSPEKAVTSIFHPSDFSQASDVAFAHALKFALVVRAGLSILHVSRKRSEADWDDFPGVRETLERWGSLPVGSRKAAVADLGIRVTKVMAVDDDPVRSASRFLSKHEIDLIVLATHQHDGSMRWLHRNVAAPLARQSRLMTLFVPHGVDGFVAAEDGAISLENIVIPVDRSPRPQPAIDAAVRAATNLRVERANFTLVFVGDESEMPAVRLPERDGWNWNTVVRQGQPVESILDAATDASAELIVMATAGRNGFLDALRGSTTERVLRGTSCPLLAVPA